MPVSGTKLRWLFKVLHIPLYGILFFLLGRAWFQSKDKIFDGIWIFGLLLMSFFELFLPKRKGFFETIIYLLMGLGLAVAEILSHIGVIKTPDSHWGLRLGLILMCLAIALARYKSYKWLHGIHAHSVS